jgi:hypothetical protein
MASGGAPKDALVQAIKDVLDVPPPIIVD